MNGSAPPDHLRLVPARFREREALLAFSGRSRLRDYN
jgi:hypothetical protein